jgi:mannose-6-phosphate isomerase
LLDQLEGAPTPQDGNQPEDWLASTLSAVNPGIPLIQNEGVTYTDGPGGRIPLQQLLNEAPAYYLGDQHAARSGAELGFLAKLLDSFTRLPIQAHPTAEFARTHLHSPWGKLEAYVIIGLRWPEKSYLYLGFQRPPSPEEWRRIVLEQDLAAMEACFDPIPVRVGDVWLVPGGLPHAIGEGLLMLEVMEPSDLVVRCEFERGGVVVPPEARFMQSPVDLALQIFDYTPLSVAQVISRYRIAPIKNSECTELLIGPSQTHQFSISRMTIRNRETLPSHRGLRLGVVAHGRGMLTVENQTMDLKPGARFLLAAAAPDGQLLSAGDEPLQVLFCSPGTGSAPV